MAIIPQKQLFTWKEIENLGDLDRLKLVLDNLPDEQLMRVLEQERDKGRDDYPVRAVWNTILAGVVFQHQSVESLRRELLRNGQLRCLCGLDLAKGEDAVPPSWVYTRFLKKLLKHEKLIEQMFDDLVEDLRELLPDFGQTLAIDGKAIPTHARAPRKDEKPKSADGRRDTDADWGKKTYKKKRKDGTLWERVKNWFGYKLHLVVDADYELPVAFEVTKASASEIPLAHQLVDQLGKRHKELLEGCGCFLADKGLDDGKLIVRLWDEHEIKPVIAIRDMWKDGEETKRVSGTRNVVYNYKGEVFCCCMKTGELRPMAYGGFEKERGTLKYRCPALHYGIECKSFGRCSARSAVRIKLEEDRRIFTPLARSSYVFKRVYKKRTAVERVNSRLDVSFGFENHFIRGLKKMKLRCGLALIVMLSMAVGRVKEKQVEKLRSLVQVA
jgi:hypothetical protein